MYTIYDRMYYAKEAAKQFVGGMLTEGSEINVGLTDFSGKSHFSVALTQDAAELNSKIDSQDLNAKHGDGTNYTAGLKAAKAILDRGENKNKFIVFLSDGEPERGSGIYGPIDGKLEADALKNSGVTIMTVGIDVDSGTEDSLIAISSVDKDDNPLYTAAASDALDTILDQLRQTIQETINAGENAVMTDVVNTDYFEVEDAGGLTTDVDGALVWDIGTIGAEEQTVSFTIRLKEDVDPSGVIKTNTGVSLEFESTKTGGPVEFTTDAIGSPEIDFGEKYTVTYNLNGGTPDPNGNYDPVTVRENETITIASAPTKEGYVFTNWQDENGTSYQAGTELSVAEDMTLTAVYELAATPFEPDHVLYIVEHYKETLDGTYPETADETERLPGEIGDEVTATAKSYTGFSLDAENSIMTGTLKKIESAEDIVTLKLYYARNFYTVTYQVTGNAPADSKVPETASYMYGAPVEIAAPLTTEEATDGTYDGKWTFIGWDHTENFEMPAEDVMITGAWTFVAEGQQIEPKVAAYKVEHYLENEGGEGYTLQEEDTDFPLYGEIGKTVTANPKEYSGYALNTETSIQSGEVVMPTLEGEQVKILTLKLYYDIDVVGGDDGGDGTPDKYQKKVTFEVVNGTWADGTTDPKVEYLTLETEGKWAENGSAALTAPTDMIAGEGFKNGAWDTTPPETVSGTEDVTYTYTFIPGTTPIIPGETVLYIVEHYKADADGTYPETATDTERLPGKIGDTVTAEAKTYEGYCLNEQVSTMSGTLKKIESADDIVTLRLYYDIDVVGGDDGGDGTPDKYQKKVTFEVVNGTWADGTTDPKVEYLTLETEGKWAENGSAALTAPTDMIAGEGFKNGAWDTTPPETVSGTEDVTYTYTFIPGTTPIIPGETVLYIVEHYKADADGTYPETATDTERLPGKIGDTVTAEAKTYEGYCLNEQVSTMSGTLKKIESADDIVTLRLYYDTDKVGGTEPGQGDEIPDKYQVKVTYKTNNNYGTVNKTSEVFTLKDDQGEYVASGSITVSATASRNTSISRTYFSNWTITGVPGSTSGATLNKAITVEGGKDYTVTANFGRSSYDPGDDDDDDDDPPRRDDDDDTTILDEEVPLAGDLNLNKEDHFAYIKGYADGTVRPNNYITRAQVATIFYRLMTEETRAIYFADLNNYSDVSADYWANKAISTLSNAGVITGFQDGTFRPNAYISRAQFAAIAARFSVVQEGLPNLFTDVPEDYWAKDEIAYASYLGWIDGYADGTFRPKNNITRAAAMKLINNVLERRVDEEGLLANATQWSDNNPSDWHYFVVLEATNSHDYDRRVKDELMENWTALNADPVWDE
ncbi:S-layer homology domain-containing protein [uncultured Dysosmobacter sp.]|uniref:S-layer homology domain-containing protein n=1 Tax=uncultured Dysosmobacter sp. TaxID=2591384 RepID=UPI002638AB02|nr:S-layer homology domain-containing protein [uncultured Dysosmobacter sp.]